MVRRLALLALLCGCKAQLGSLQNQTSNDANGSNGPQDGGPVDARPIDGQPDAPTGPWGTPAVIPDTAAAGVNVDDPTMTQDGLDIIYGVATTAGKSLFEIQRTTTSSPWSTPVERAELNLGAANESPRFSPDDKTIYFGVDGSIYTATRTAAGDAFGAPAPVAAANTGAYQKWFAVCGAAGNAMVSRANPTTANMDLFEGTIANGAPTVSTALNSADSEISTFLAHDCKSVYFASNRSGTAQLYTATRPAVGGAWSTPVNVDSPFSANDGTDNEDPWLSADGHIFLFAGIRGGSTVKQLYISTR